MPYLVVLDYAALLGDIESACKMGAEKALEMRPTMQIEFKNDGSIVTAADRDIETDLRAEIARIDPGTPIWGEEQGYEPPNENGLWMIDPIDGTSNFAFGQPLWGVTAALYRDEKIRLGVIVVPELNWSLTAIDGQGAFCNGKPLPRVKPGVIAPYELVGVANIDAAQRARTPGKLRHIGAFVVEAGIFLRGGMRVLVTNGVRMYDAAAGIVMAREIGAQIRELDGSDWRDEEWVDNKKCRPFGFFPPDSDWPFQSQ